MDRFSISLEGYHELAQVQQSLPRTHHIESFAKVLDSQCWTAIEASPKAWNTTVCKK